MFCIADILYAHHLVCETYFTVNRNEVKIVATRKYGTFPSGTSDPVYDVFVDSMDSLAFTAGRIISDATTGEIVVTEISISGGRGRVRAEGGLASADNAIERNVRCLEAGIREAARRAQEVYA